MLQEVTGVRLLLNHLTRLREGHSPFLLFSGERITKATSCSTHCVDWMFFHLGVVPVCRWYLIILGSIPDGADPMVVWFFISVPCTNLTSPCICIVERTEVTRYQNVW